MISMIKKQEANWELYHEFEDAVYQNTDLKIKKILDRFDIQDFQEMPIIYDLINYKKIRLLKYINSKNIPFTYEEDCGGNSLHAACGAGGSLECVKFLIENNLLTDINKKSTKYGDTPLTLAICYGHKDIVDYFKNKFGVSSISLDDLGTILDRMKVNYRKQCAKRKGFCF